MDIKTYKDIGAINYIKNSLEVNSSYAIKFLSKQYDLIQGKNISYKDGKIIIKIINIKDFKLEEFNEGDLLQITKIPSFVTKIEL